MATEWRLGRDNVYEIFEKVSCGKLYYINLETARQRGDVPPELIYRESLVVDGISIYGPEGRQVARFGEWITCGSDGVFRPGKNNS